MARERREVWEKRIARLRESGLTTKEFAVELGCNADTLRHWKYKLGSAGSLAVPRADGEGRTSLARTAEPVEFVEVIGPTLMACEAAAEPIEVVLCKATIRVPRSFDSETLGRLLAVLEAR